MELVQRIILLIILSFMGLDVVHKWVCVWELRLELVLEHVCHQLCAKLFRLTLQPIAFSWSCIE